MAFASVALPASPDRHAPSPWRGVPWAWARGRSPIGRAVLAGRAALAALGHRKAMKRWMALVHELHARRLVADPAAEALRALRPHVHRHTDTTARVTHLIEHTDWLETALQPSTFESLWRGESVVLADLPPPRGYDSLRLQLQRSAPNSPEGELLLTLALQRARAVQPSARAVDVAALAFSRFRIDGTPCFVIGGVRNQRSDEGRLSPMELTHALQGWKAPVLMVRVAQELARWWGLRLVALDPAAHRLHGWSYRWSRRHRATAQRIVTSYDALWNHFDATRGPLGWVVLPAHADEKLAATALSPERRARQSRRADYWIRTRTLLREHFREHLVRQGYEAGLRGVTQNLGPRTIVEEEAGGWDAFDDIEPDRVPSRVLETGPAPLD